MWHKEISTFNELYGHVSSSNPLRALPCLAPKLYTRRTTLMQSTIPFMRWLAMRLDTEEPLRDFLTDILVNYKIDKYHLKMQRKNQFVKMSFYELVLFWSSSNKHLFVLHFYHTFCRFHSAQDSETYSLCLHLIHHRFNTGKGTNIH